MRRRLGAAVVLALLAACGEAPDEVRDGSTAPADARPEPLVVFASYEDEAFLPGLAAGFTRETGIRVTVRHRDDAANVDDMIGKRSSKQPDVLVTRSVIDAWRAAGEGMLRPLAPGAIPDAVPETLRDPNGYWAAIGYSTVVVAYDARTVDPAALSDYAGLGDEALRGRLCLSTSALPSNTALIAHLVAAHGRREAEIVVRGWVRNLALPPFGSERELLAAIGGGACALGIVSTRAVEARPDADRTIAVHVPRPAYADAVTAGVGRHARSPDAAADFVRWLLDLPQQQAHAAGHGGYPARTDALVTGEPGAVTPDGGIGAGGAFAVEAALLAERASYR